MIKDIVLCVLFVTGNVPLRNNRKREKRFSNHLQIAKDQYSQCIVNDYPNTDFATGF